MSKRRHETTRVDQAANHAEVLNVLKLACGELDRQTLNYERRFDSVQSKAALLVTGAAVVAGLSTGRGGAVLLATTLPALAAMLSGVLAMWPRKRKALSISGVRQLLLPSEPPIPSEHQALLTLFDYRSFALTEGEADLRKMGSLLRAGFVLLSVSLLPLVFSAIVDLTQA